MNRDAACGPEALDAGQTTPPPELDAGLTAPPPELDAGLTTPPPELDAGLTTPPPLADTQGDLPTLPPPSLLHSVPSHATGPGLYARASELGLTRRGDGAPGDGAPSELAATAPLSKESVPEPGGDAATRADDTAADDAATDPTAALPCVDGLPESLREPPPAPRGRAWRAQSLVGCRLGPWGVVRRIGEGAWGAVFLVRDTGDPSRQAALKVPKLIGGDGTGQVLPRFRIEAETIERIHAAGPSPHVVGFCGAEPEARPYPWLALEYVEGHDLGAELRRRRKLPLRDALRFALGILDGLHEAHRAGVVHRDLKPENVLIAADGGVRVADFGVARRAGAQDEDGGLTVTGQQVGTPHYMSPEQIDGQAEPASDLYSFGAMLYAMLAGRPPFRGQLMAVIDAHLHKPAPALADFLDDCPPALDQLVARLLAKDPRERPGLTECQAQLNDILADLEEEPAEESEAPVALELKPDDRVDEYTIEREVGRGGMGIVYAARDDAGRRFALKVGSFVFSSQGDARDQLKRDAQFAVEVTRSNPHPAVAQVYEVREATVRGVPIVYLISELVEGPSLAELISEGGPLDEQSALQQWRGVAQGLAAIHQAGVLHLDLSPGNILVAGIDPDAAAPRERFRAAHPKIVDFGISRRVESQTLRKVEGNPGYMSPEQCDGEAPSLASDIYMLGATYYHTVTGRPPFSGEPLAVMNQHRATLPPFADLEDQVVGQDLALVIHRCLRKRPEDRYPTASELLEDLRRVGTSEFPRKQLQQAWAQEVARYGRQRARVWRIVAGVLAAVMLVAAGSGLFVWSEFQRQAEEAHRRRLADAAQQRAEKIAGVREQIAQASEEQLNGAFAAIDGLTPAPDLREDLQLALAARAVEIYAELRETLDEQAGAIVAQPGEARGQLKNLLELQAVFAESIAQRPECFAAANVDDGGVPRPLSRAAQRFRDEAEALVGLCAVSDHLRGKEWDRTEAGLAGFAQPPGATSARVVRELRAAYAQAVAEIEQAYRQAEAAVEAQLDAKAFARAEELHAAFAEQVWSYRNHGRTRDAHQALEVRIHAAKAADPLEEIVAEARIKLEARLEVNAHKPLLRVHACEDFQDTRVTLDGKERRYEEARAAEPVEEWLRAARADHTRAALAAWDERLAAARSAAAGPPTPARFQAQEAALHALPERWFQAGSQAVWAVPAQQTLQQAVDAALAALRARRDRSIADLVAASEDALGRPRGPDPRPLDLSGALREYALAAAFQGNGLSRDQARRLELVRRQVELFELLNGEAIRVEVGPHLPVGVENNELYPARAAEVPEAVLLVDRYEARVAVYALFLEVLATAGDHHSLGFCHPDEPPTDHQPLAWESQLAQPEQPVRGVSWFDAYACARWAGRRLPHADEWELAARGRTGALERLAPWLARRSAGVARVGVTQEETPRGIADTAGNVSEWTQTPARAPDDGFLLDAGWGGDSPPFLVCGPNVETPPVGALQLLYLRGFLLPGSRAPILGFRCVREETP